MTRYCPKCGEAVPSNSLTCPKCYTKMPPQPKKTNEKEQGSGSKNKSRQTRLALTIIPAFFGVLGLGQIYRNYKASKGYFFLITGLLFFYLGNALLFIPSFDIIVAGLKTFFGVGLLFIYVLIFLLSLFDSLIDFNVVLRKQ